ncbi:hypothetical protein PHLCEN_2v3204 [Hermanssonia centrifuga]|uniref:Uncharacterized protein n=1 Tax=Hermanssonia centrifuga TaxID=98765 RepID=A0A2R6R0W6_9APHY|nr:hypothetical protein PHLCEN_2v3204 [Hermanssonia centrifuga]
MSANLASYLKGMHSQSVTCNWDVAVTYDEAKINALLADRWAQPGSDMTTEVDIQEKTDDRLGEYYQNYQFNLGPPLIQFQSSSSNPTCSLKTPIASGSIWVSEIDDPDTKENEKQLNPDTYWITISNIHLSALDGNAEPAGTGDDTITFPANDESDRYIVIDIPITGENDLAVSVDYPYDYEPPTAMKQAFLETALKQFLKKKTNAFAYRLASINNYKPSSGTLDLVPQAFRFVTYHYASDNSSFLTLLVQTKGSSSPGDTKDVQAEWVTTWTNRAKVPPVPSTQSASIIINNSFFLQSFVRPALRSQTTSMDDITITDDIGGIGLQCQWPKQSREQKNYSQGYGDITSWPLDWKWSELHVPEAQYDPNNGSPLMLTFSHSNGFDKPATLHIYWQYKYKSTWNGVQIKRFWLKDPDGPGQWVPDTKKCDGSFNTTYTLDKTISLTDLSDEDLSINVDARSDEWRTDPVPDAGNGFWGDISAVFGGTAHQGDIPSFVKDTTMGGIEFTLSFGKLRFFSVTNILLPGQKVIDVNIKNGLCVPRDCTILGNVVEPANIQE